MRSRTTFVTLAAALTVAVGARVAVQPMQAQARPASPVPIRLYVFDGGTLESDPARYQLTKEDVGVDAAVGRGLPDRSPEGTAHVGCRGGAGQRMDADRTVPFGSGSSWLTDRSASSR